MDAFRTEVLAPEFPFSLDHGSPVMFMGSCFAENMGELLQAHKIPSVVNPFGILFNPFSIMNALERMLNERPYTETDLVQVGEHFVSLDHHSRFNHRNKGEALSLINDALAKGADQLRQSDTLFITLGTAWVYHHLKRNHTVANCHKIPNREFEKRLLSFQDVHLIVRHIPQFIQSKRLDMNIVFTVSPVRHWKDGAIENQRSKATLLTAVHEVVQEFEQAHYFPAYELLMDDLRDYRFYTTDMLHPTAQAIDYVWDKFQQSFFSDETRIICQEVKSVVQAANHRPADPESNSFQRFVKKQIDLIQGLEDKYPLLDLSAERERFERYRLV